MRSLHCERYAKVQDYQINVGLLVKFIEICDRLESHEKRKERESRERERERAWQS